MSIREDKDEKYLKTFHDADNDPKDRVEWVRWMKSYLYSSTLQK